MRAYPAAHVSAGHVHSLSAPLPSCETRPWHLPLFFLPGTGGEGQSFPLYLLHVTAVSMVIAWLYWKTGGVSCSSC
jgi:hypothetical protein